MREHLVIIGGGMAGVKLAKTLSEQEQHLYDITVISEEANVGYNRIMLSPLLADEISESDMALVDLSAMQQSNVNIIAGTQVTKVKLDSRQLTLSNRQILSFDKLVFATGSRSRMPESSEQLHENLIGFRDLNDVAKMANLPDNSSIVVVGGGLLGLEAAVGLVKRGHRVTVVHRSSHLLNRQLDTQAGALLQAELEAQGVHFILHDGLKELIDEGTNRIKRISLNSGRELDTDCVVMAAGIVPEVSVAKDAGLEVNKAIVVNEWLETSRQNVFALGECTEYRKQTFGLVAPIWDQVDVLVARLVGSHKNYRGPFQVKPTPVKLKVSGINLFSVGNLDEFEGGQSLVFKDPSARHYRRLVVKDGKLVGAILFGNVADGGWYFQLIQNNTDITPFSDRLLFGETYCQAS